MTPRTKPKLACPICHSRLSVVLTIPANPSDQKFKRVRKCVACGHVFRTTERVDPPEETRNI